MGAGAGIADAEFAGVFLASSTISPTVRQGASARTTSTGVSMVTRATGANAVWSNERIPE